MTAYINKLKDKNSNQQLPVTHERAVRDDNGTTLESKMQNLEGAMDKAYVAQSDNGMGRITLKKNIVSGVNTLTQSMMQATNTIYVIKYDFTLGEDITVPANCVLEFDGGSISAGSGENKDTITGTNTGIQARLVKIFNTNVTLAGTWNVTEAYPEWFGAKGDDTTDNTNAISKVCNSPFVKVVFLLGTYVITDTIELTNPAIWIVGTLSNQFGRRTTIKNTTAGKGIFHITQMSSWSQTSFPTIEGFQLIADNPIKFNDSATAIIVDGEGSNIPYGMLPRIINCNLSPYSGGRIGVGIEWVKCFDGRIQDCELSGFNIGVCLLGSDINLISNNRIWACNYLICDFSVSTFGSQNEIHHNDLLYAYKTYIKTTDRQVRIYDNYFEGSQADYVIDITNIGFEIYGNSTVNGYGYTINNQGNRLENSGCTLYRINNKYRYIYINDLGTYYNSNPLQIIDNSGNDSYLEWFEPNYTTVIYDITLPGFARWTNNIMQPKNFNDNKIKFTNENYHYSLVDNGFRNYAKHGYHNMIWFANNSTLYIDEYSHNLDLLRNTCYIFSIRAKLHNNSGNGSIGGLPIRGKGGYGSEVTLTLTTEYKDLDIHIVTDTTNTNQGIAILRVTADADVESISVRVADYGPSTLRPSNAVEVGFKYFDTTLSKPIYWNGSAWVDATGTTV